MFDPKTLIVGLTFLATFSGVLAVLLPFSRKDKKGRRVKELSKSNEQIILQQQDGGPDLQ